MAALNGFGSGSRHGNCASTSSQCCGSASGCPSADRVFLLETQLSSLRQQMSVLAVEMGLAYEWIRNTFGIQLVNVDSPHYKSVHGPSFEMQAIQKSLEVTVTEAAAARVSNAEGSTSTSTIATSSEGTVSQRRRADTKSSTSAKVPGSCGESTADIITATQSQSPASSGSALTNSNSRGGGTGQTRRGLNKQFRCQFCQQSFTEHGNRTRHERIHTGVKPFKCRFCNDSFNQKANQLAHERHRHTREKPYKCGEAECPMSFASATHKKRHERSHAGEKPYACEYCDKKFKGSLSLGIHMRTHTGEKPFVCQHPGCGEEFYSSKALRTHRLKRHGLN